MNTLWGWGGLARTSRDTPQEPTGEDATTALDLLTAGAVARKLLDTIPYMTLVSLAA